MLPKGPFASKHKNEKNRQKDGRSNKEIGSVKDPTKNKYIIQQISEKLRNEKKL